MVDHTWSSCSLGWTDKQIDIQQQFQYHRDCQEGQTQIGNSLPGNSKKVFGLNIVSTKKKFFRSIPAVSWMNFINNLTYVASIVSWKYNIASIIGWLSRVSNFITIGAQIIKGPREKHAVLCCSVVHEPVAGVAVQVLAECLTFLRAINLSYFLRNEYDSI